MYAPRLNNPIGGFGRFINKSSLRVGLCDYDYVD